MLTKTEIETCCANLMQRFNALEETRQNIAKAFDTAIGRRLSALMENGLTRYNIPNDRNAADVATYFSSNALKSSGCRCYFEWSESLQTLIMGFCPADRFGSSNITESCRYLQVVARRDDHTEAHMDAVFASFHVNGSLGNNPVRIVPLRKADALNVVKTCLSEDMRAKFSRLRPLEDYIRDPKDVQAFVNAHETLKDYEKRLCRIAHLVGAASEILSALEARQGATEKERDERVRFIFGLANEGATPLATVYRVKLMPEPYSDAK